HLPDSAPAARCRANVVLPNGARLDLGRARPECSSSEVRTPRAAVLWDRAGRRVAEGCVRTLASGPEPVNLYKNNTDSKGSSYGSHENYLVRRVVAFEMLADQLIPFFTTRAILFCAGRLGIGRSGDESGTQISS